MAIKPVFNLKIAAKLAACGLVFVFLTSPVADAVLRPTVTTNPAVLVNSTTLRLNASVTPNHSTQPAYVWFEFGTSLGALAKVGLQGPFGPGFSTSNVSFDLGGLQPNTTYYYRAVAENYYGKSEGSILTLVTPAGSSSQSSSASPLAPIISTKGASFVSSGSALFNGQVSPNGSFTDAWFEWGTSASLGSFTNRQPMGNGMSSINYSFIISGLRPNTAYYFRAAARNQYGTNYGEILSFTTGGLATAPPPSVANSSAAVVRTNTASSARSGPSFSDIDAKVFLFSEVDNKNPRQGEEFNLTIKAKNTSSVAIDEVTLKITLPQEIEYVSSSIPPREKTDFQLSFLLGTIGSRGESALNVRLKTREDAAAGSAPVFNISLSYFDPAGREHFLNSFLAAKVERGAANFAAIFSGGASWIFLIGLPLLLLVLVIYWVRGFMKRKQEDEERREAAMPTR